jgi:hypothetical protein
VFCAWEQAADRLTANYRNLTLRLSFYREMRTRANRHSDVPEGDFFRWKTNKLDWKESVYNNYENKNNINGNTVMYAVYLPFPSNYTQLESIHGEWILNLKQVIKDDHLLIWIWTTKLIVKTHHIYKDMYLKI